MTDLAVRLRPRTEADSRFVAELLAEDARVVLAGLPEGLREEMVALQVTARAVHLADAWPEAVESIVIAGPDGLAVGRIVLAEGAGWWHIVDLRIHQDWRDQGIGTACLADLAAQADLAGCGMRLTVAVDNPARRLYERLGFMTVPGDEQGAAPRVADVTMERPAAR